jgi:hypothetical protein
MEKIYPQKCACRPTAKIRTRTGHHSISGTDGPRTWPEEVVCLHAPTRLRAASAERKFSASRVAAGRNPNQGRNRRRLAAMQGEAAIDAGWAANSYENGGRRPHPLPRRLLNRTIPASSSSTILASIHTSYAT